MDASGLGPRMLHNCCMTKGCSFWMHTKVCVVNISGRAKSKIKHVKDSQLTIIIIELLF